MIVTYKYKKCPVCHVLTWEHSTNCDNCNVKLQNNDTVGLKFYHEDLE